MRKFKDSEYFVSEDGNIFRNGKKRKTQKNKKGYYQIALSNNGVRINISIHRVVAICFIPNTDNKPQVNHIDGNKLNNHYCNLEWVNNSENQIHAFNNGLKKTKLTKEQVLEIRNSKNKSSTELSNEYKVHRRTIERILKRQLWARI